MKDTQNIESFSFAVEEKITPPKKLFQKITLKDIMNKYSKKIYSSSFKNEKN